MKIAYILPSLINKGPIIVAHTIVKNIIDKVEDIHVYYFDDDLVLKFPCPTFKLDMNTAIDFDDYDIIHTHGLRPDRYVNRWRKGIKTAKTVSTIHADIAQDFRFGYNKLVSIIFTPLWLSLMNKHDAVVVISDKLRSLYDVKFKNLHRIYNGVDIELNESQVDLKYVNEIKKFKKRDLKIVGSYAALNKRKGIDQIVNLLSVRKDLAMVFIGEGKEVEVLKNLSKTIGVFDRVLFLPYLTKPYNYIHLFDVYVMPSRSEGFGLALVEAALTKTPIVCSNIDVFKEIFNDSQVTFFDLEDTDSLGLAISEAILSKDTKRIKAYERVVESFSGKTMGENYFDFYIKLVKGINFGDK
ncbi:glycosyltransferase [Pedobacter psychrodurus]|uniref:Glycosyltransferase n=1 Tax=Pedobacter psychrodurus TaxID=2530456 RepID=A0A4R0PG97_9SPHI|nr:glycosyltransferase family 4 protein [Pedobacter psychrodurus]TCD17345.1 glycosyltransferase [Pedobacter psychrodurus]